MQVVRTARFKRQFKKAPESVQKKFAKQVAFLLVDIGHPSLNAKIYDPNTRLWQARVDHDWRFYFQIQDDHCYLLDIIKHPK